MFGEDYIMRQIRQLSQALTKLLFLKDSKQYQDALEEIQHTGKLFFGLDLNAIHTITYEELQEALRAKNAQDVEHVSLLAELLRQRLRRRRLQQRWVAGSADRKATNRRSSRRGRRHIVDAERRPRRRRRGDLHRGKP